MNAWITPCNIEMANNLMKWWRTKFLNGYRQFSADCNEGRVSDTEELLGRLSPDSVRAEDTTPPPQPAPQQPQAPHQHLNLEEFSCDVSVEGGVDKHGQERQEFSFTLYDFDGHGKITKDDIAGLVTTIYEVLGSSVKVPHYGSKTIRVKLTVSPDQRKHVSATVINNQKEKDEKQPPTNERLKHDVNVTIRQAKKKKAKERRHQCCHHEDEADEYSDESDASSRISGCEDEEAEFTEEQPHYKCPKSKQKKPQHQRPPSPKYTIPNLFIRENNLINQETCLKTRKAKRRSSSLQRQELLEIIQANMDKNNLSFQTARKQCMNHVSLESKQLQPVEEKPHRHRHRSGKLQTTPLHCLANIMDPTHFYVDLAALQNTTHLPESNCQYNKLINAVMCVNNNTNGKKVTQGCRRHINPSSSNIPVRYQPVNGETSVNNNNKKTAKVTEAEPVPAFKKNVKKFPQVVLGHTSSPHHLRHRNRQEDQARAMAQVVRWLEQEFSSTEKKEAPGKSDSWTSAGEKQSGGGGGGGTSSTNAESGVERHEHHHVHEHIHHHYHHYQETPVVV